MSFITNPTIQTSDLLASFGNRCLTKAVLAINLAGAATIKTTGPTSYTVGGVYQTAKASLAAQSIAIAAGYGPLVGGAGYVQPISTSVYYVVSLNAAGTVFVRQGTYVGQPLSTLGDKGDGSIPAIPLTETALGYFRVTTNASVTFTPGTTLLDAAGITVVYTDTDII